MPVHIIDRTIAFWVMALLAAGGALTAGAEEYSEGVHAYVTDNLPESVELADAIFLESPSHSGEYLVIAVTGTVKDFRYSRVEYVDQFSPLAESCLISGVDSLTDQTVVIHSAMTCGIPSERVSWTTPAGTEHRIHLSASGIGEPLEWHFTMD